MKIAIGLSDNIIYDARLANAGSEGVIQRLLQAYTDPQKDSVFLLTISSGEIEITYCGPPYDDDHEQAVPAQQLRLITGMDVDVISNVRYTFGTTDENLHSPVGTHTITERYDDEAS